MHYHEDDDLLNRADCVPTFLTIYEPLYKRHAAGVIENELRCFKSNTVLPAVYFVFRFIPFDPHLCLQYSTYAYVKSSGEMLYQRPL